jgi:transcriptional regulator with GAF, ATPase, and Fis domain
MSNPPSTLPSFDAEAALRLVLRRTAGVTGEEFYKALVESLAQVLGTTCAWVTEYDAPQGLLRGLAFWYNGSFIEGYQALIANTPCERVIQEACFVQIPDRILEIYAHDPELVSLRALSYIGMPLFDVDGSIMGHLAALDTKPMPSSPDLEEVFSLFAERAAAEHRRLRVESRLRDREVLLSRILNSATDAIVVLDDQLRIVRFNPAAGTLFGIIDGNPIPLDLVFCPSSVAAITATREQIVNMPPGRQRAHIPGVIDPSDHCRAAFRAEATLAAFESHQGRHFTFIARDLTERFENEKRLVDLATEAEFLREAARDVAEAGAMVGNSPPMQEVYTAIARVAPANTTVLVQGETGTGKELVARAIHRSSPRAAGHLVAVNCAAIPKDLIESEFFGHERGSFTGATSRREGRFALADGGTLFLDEIGELPIELQVKLLRVLQEGEFTPVGSTRVVRVNVRVIAATNRDLESMIRAGTFREDLYYRIGVFPIRLPPLRERGADIELLAQSFADLFARRMGRQAVTLSEEDRRLLRSYAWPGNVRELQNVIERAIILSMGPRLQLRRALPDAARLGVPPPSPLVATGSDPPPILTEVEMRRFERENILRALDACGWKISGTDGAAARLGLAASTLSSRMKTLGISQKG